MKAAYQPVRIDYQTLANNSDEDVKAIQSMMETLHNVGMVSVTNFPSSFRRNKQTVQAYAESCSQESQAAKTHVFQDGTKRTTMASHTVAGPGGIQALKHGDTAACETFAQASQAFRQEVDAITRNFASLISKDVPASEPLLVTEGGHALDTFFDVVDYGEHLEHFHVYHHNGSFENEDTIEWHTDQGLFLAFTPGVWTNQDHQVSDTTDGFYIQLQDGSQPMVSFDEEDDLVFLLGDGVNQVLNRQVAEEAYLLRAVPHALAMPTPPSSDVTRFWYGRMVLPAAEAIHPFHKGQTYGQIRHDLVHGDSDKNGRIRKEVLALGCSDSTMGARQLQDTSCSEEAVYCWHRCMAAADHGVSTSFCAEQGLDLHCINPRYQKWDNSHGDWFPGCIDVENAPNATPYDPLPNYPRDEASCTGDAFASFIAAQEATYDYSYNLTQGGHILWSVEGDKIKGMVAYDGLFGYVGFGFAGDGPRNKMQRALILMANPSSVYSARYGFDYTYGPSVDEFLIGDQLSFRHWQTPVSGVPSDGDGSVTIAASSTSVSDPNSYGVQEYNCYTSMTFNTAGIHNKPFNVSGTDELIWAANGMDIFAGYHGPARGVFNIEWKTGKASKDAICPHGHCVDGNGEDDLAHDENDKNNTHVKDDEKKDDDKKDDTNNDKTEESAAASLFVYLGLAMTVIASTLI